MIRLRSGSASHVGQVRTVNQDLALESPDLFAVADGMGGHVAGEVAARVAMDALQEAFDAEPTVEGLKRAVAQANAAVWARSLTTAALRGMGTTITAAARVHGPAGDVVALANVGDSRAYLFSGGRLAQVTADHSVAEEKVRMGELTEAEAAVHPQRHMLTRALGVSATVDVDLWELHLSPGDRVLLCSDGLSNEVSGPEIAEVLAAVPDPARVAEMLVDEANEHGGSDNITAVVVDVVAADPAPDDGTGSDGARAVAGAAPTGAAVAGAVPTGAAVAGAAPTGALPGAIPEARTRASSAPIAVETLNRPEPSSTIPAPAVRGVPTSGVLALDEEPQAGAGPAPAGRPPAPSAARETRRQRRRRLGIPRRVTARVILFFILLGGVAAAGYYFVRWYANDSWYVTVDGSQLVVYQGRPGGVLWFQPKVVERTGVTTADVLPLHQAALRADVPEPSRAAADQFVHNLVQEKQSLSPPTTTTAPPVTTTTATTTTTTTTAGGAGAGAATGTGAGAGAGAGPQYPPPGAVMGAGR